MLCAQWLLGRTWGHAIGARCGKIQTEALALEAALHSPAPSLVLEALGHRQMHCACVLEMYTAQQSSAHAALGRSGECNQCQWRRVLQHSRLKHAVSQAAEG